MSYFDEASLVMIPSGYKDQKVYSVKPINGDGDFTFSRASEATRLVDGVVTKVRTNSLTYSNDFSNAIWQKNVSTVTSGQADKDGGTDAWLLDKTAAYGYVRQDGSFSGVNSISIYAKAGTLNWMRVIASGGSSTPSTWFDLANGVVGAADYFTIGSSIESVGNGWYRCSITFDAGTFVGARFYPADGNNDVSGTSGNILIQSAQIEQGLVATDYIATTTVAVSEGPVANMPRLNSVAGGCPSLLLEPQRTNLITQSEYFGGTYWTKLGATIVDNSIASADGYVNASKLVEDTSTGIHVIYQNAGVTIASGTATLSVFVKENGRSFFQIRTGSAAGITNAPLYANFDLVNNLVTAQSVGADSAIIEAYPNGWKRVSVSFTLTSGSVVALVFQTITSGTAVIAESYTGDGTSGVYIYGAQLEEGSYATSYIPTYGTAATRIADAASKSGISSLIGQTEGTIFVEANLSNIIDPTNLRGILEINDGTTSNRFSIYRGANDLSLSVIVFTAAAAVANIAASTISGQIKIAVAYNSSDVTVYINGSLIGTDTSVTIPACSDLDLGIVTTNTTRILGDGINQALIFKTRLTNAELATLTTL